MTLPILSAGAAKAVVTALAAQAGVTLNAAFGAVGAIQDKLLAGEPCDVIVLTRAMIDALATQGRVHKDSIGDLGRVRTGVAVKTGVPLPDTASAAGLRAALLAADAIYVPDTVKSTAGKHVATVLDSLGIAEEVRGRLREFPNGAAAMRAMGEAPGQGAIGCTQISEILYTGGITLIGPLPAEFELATVYSAAVCAQATNTVDARRFVALLSGESTRPLRSKSGFEV